jgi:hypothetical protein
MARSRSSVIRAEGGTLKWFKLHHEVMFDSKVQTLSPELFRSWINVLCMASANKDRGYLPDIKQVAYVLHCSKSEAQAVLDELADEGLLDRDAAGRFRPHNWDARQGREDKSTDRVRKYREKVKGKLGSPDKTAPEPIKKDRKQNETRFATVTKRLRNGDETPDETEMKRDETPLEEIRLEESREEESLSNDNNSAHGRDEVVVDGGTFAVISPEHRRTIEHARAVVSERFAAVVADQGSSLDASLGGRWDCYRAAIDAMKACGKRIDKPAVYCRQTALGFCLHGIPKVADVPLEPSMKTDRKGNPVLTPEQEAERRARLREKLHPAPENSNGR